MIHKSTRDWDYSVTPEYAQGGPSFYVPNQSSCYHGLLKQWWDHYKVQNASWLLISELNKVKSYFVEAYPGDSFSTMELYADSDVVDYQYDLCDRSFPAFIPKFDVVVCQATLEHVYDPYSAMLNMASILNKDGLLTVHTHTQYFMYHQYPRDYFRFFPDWFIDMPNHFKAIELLDLYDNDGHIFASYKKK